MFRPLEAYIGLRYVRAKRRNHFISFITVISMVGVALGVWALITVLSVMNGFETELRDRILGMAAHVTVERIGEPVRDWREVEKTAAHMPHVLGVAPYIRGEAMASTEGRSRGVLVRGIDPAEEPNVSEVGNKMVAGKLANLKPGQFGVIIGSELAASLGVRAGDKLTLIIPQATVTAAGVLPRFKRFDIVGVFDVGMHEYDSGLVLMNIKDAGRLYNMRNGVTGVRLRLDDMFLAPKVGRELAQQLPPGYLVNNWTSLHTNLFRAIGTEKRMMFIILFLIVTVAAFNIVSTLVMVVTDKEADIAILRTLGATPRTIMGVFMVQGAFIGVIGTLAGLATGVPTAINVETIVSTIERIFHVQFLSPDVYYITELTGEVHWHEVWIICAASLIITLVATLYPAWRASRTQPAEALRYE
jgi:lipoprotein-releasing system permease protein